LVCVFFSRQVRSFACSVQPFVDIEQDYRGGNVMEVNTMRQVCDAMKQGGGKEDTLHPIREDD
jgi:hypothetical protein